MGYPTPGLFGGGRFGPEAGVEAFDDTVDDEGEAGGELGRVGDLFGGDGVGQVEAGADDGEGGIFFLRAGLGAVKGFDALEERGKKRKGAEGFSLPRASISFSVFSKAYFPLASLRIFQRSEGLAQVVRRWGRCLRGTLWAHSRVPGTCLRQFDLPFATPGKSTASSPLQSGDTPALRWGVLARGVSFIALDKLIYP
jgi:hypothetical protein